MTTGSQIAWDDSVLPFQLDASDIRGRVARLDGVLEGILKQHDYPPQVEALVAEMALLTALIGQTVKLRWKLQLQVQSKGAVRMIATDYYGPEKDGDVARIRAYASYDAERLTEAAPFDQIGEGYFAIMIDQGQGMTPYQGITRYFYLEAKVLELLALQFDLMAPPTSTNHIPPKEVDRIYQAQAILDQNMSQPPSTAELARQVNLNERKLREGFRQVCDNTVFGYLTQQRMQTACKLLTQQRSIAAVATAIGYDSSTAFSNAFRRQFGMSPKGYQLKQRRWL